MKNKEEDYKEIKCRIPSVFLRLAKFYHLEPKRLANALIFEFCCDPPKDLILVARAAPEESSDEKPSRTRRQGFDRN